MIKILAQASVFLILDVMEMKQHGFIRCGPFVCISASLKVPFFVIIKSIKFGFMRKTPEQLQAQFESVNVERKGGYQKPLNALEGSFKVTPKEARDKIIGQLGGQEQLPDEDYDHYYDRKYAYQNYVYTLRQMRKDQRTGLGQATESVKENRADAYAEAATFGTLRVQRLENLQPKHMSSGRLERALTDEQVASARQSEEKFQEMLHLALTHKPDLVMRVLKVSPDSLSREDARKFVEKAAEQRAFNVLWDYDAVEPLYTPGENRQRLEQLFAKDPASTIRTVAKASVAKHFSPEERKQFLLDAIKARSSPQLDLEEIVPYVKEGLISKEELVNIVINEFAQGDEYRRPDKFEAVADYFKAEPAKGRLTEALTKAYTRTAGALSVSGIDTFVEQGILSQQQACDILRSRIKQKSSALFDYDVVARKYLPEDEIRQHLRESLENNPEDFFHAMYNEAFQKYLTKDEIKKACLAVMEANPKAVVYSIDMVIDSFEDAEKRKQAVQTLLEAAAPTQFLYQAEKFFTALGITDNEEKKRIIRDKILEDTEYGYIEKFVGKDQLLAGLFTKDEILEILKKQLELGAGDLIYQLSHVKKLVGSDEELKKVVRVAMDKDPAGIAYNIDSVAYLYSSEEMRHFIERLAEDSRGGQVALLDVEKWARSVGDEFVWEFVQKQMVENAPVMIYKLNEIWPYIPQGKRDKFVKELIRTSPFIALEYKNKIQPKFPEITDEMVISMAKGDGERWSLAPKQLTELFDRYAKETGEMERQAMAKQGMDLYVTLGQVKEHGLELAYRRALFKEELGVKREQDLLTTFQCLSLLAKENSSLIAKAENIQSVEEVQIIVFEELCRYMGLEGSASPEAVANFFASMESPVPFTVYFTQYKKSSEHTALLKGMFEAMLQGKYREWKFGPMTEENLQELKNGQYLPKGLTLEQYKAWSEDEQGSLFETLAMDSHEAARAINKDIADNLMHLNVPRLEGLSLTEEGLQTLAQELSQLGQQLAVVNKEFGSLKKQAGVGQGRLEVLDMEKRQLEQKRRELLTARGIIRLALLKPAELVAGYLLEGQDGKKKGDPLTQLINSVRREMGQEGQFIFDNIEQKFAGFRTQTQSKQNLESTDSSSADDLFLVGVRPVGSCQHYAHGSHNDCLLGYSGPDTKIIMLRNEKGNVAARAIVRLLSLKDGSPAMHLERIYSSSLSKGVTKAMYNHALKKAEGLNMPLYTSERSQNEQGREVEIQTVEGINLAHKPDKLRSFKTKAPKVYVDSIGGARSFGKYIIANLVQIERV